MSTSEEPEESKDVYSMFMTRHKEQRHKKSAVDVLGWYRSSSGNDGENLCPLLSQDWTSCDVCIDDKKLFSISEHSIFNPDVTTNRGLSCLLHDVLMNGWTELPPRQDEPADPRSSPRTFKIQVVDISLHDNEDDAGRSFFVYVHVVVYYVGSAHAILAIRYEMDWKPVVLGILKSNFRW
ncbi:hypothetical protein SCHPADRAFT_445984 [Schizopora paradoxa]|uniref:Uncharacterized protein n=1 Tax=Schizopora paradoxa TaxID=27342 RepID=A0A0H2RJA4_9AGAM|nr:hypothetical protein SCHPADRAFT_445984 [Schizopora paradoxa]